MIVSSKWDPNRKTGKAETRNEVKLPTVSRVFECDKKKKKKYLRANVAGEKQRKPKNSVVSRVAVHECSSYITGKKKIFRIYLITFSRVWCSIESLWCIVCAGPEPRRIAEVVCVYIYTHIHTQSHAFIRTYIHTCIYISALKVNESKVIEGQI